MELDLEFFTNNVALVFLIIVSGALLLFPKILGANQKVISAKDSVILMNQENIIIIDVRSSEEFAKGKIANAINIPLDKLADNIGKLKKHQKKQLLFYCQKGIRSSQAVKLATKLGLEQCSSVDGGVDAWLKESLPMVLKA